MPQITDSRFAMWRGAIALAWVDGKLDDKEKAKISGYFKNNTHLSDEQRALLMRDLDQAVQLKDIWGSITNTEDRANLIDIAQDIFRVDGSYSTDEHDVYDKMFADQMSTVDIEQVKQDMHAMALKIPANLQAQKQEIDNAEMEMEKEQKAYEQTLNPVFRLIGAATRLIYHFEKKLGVE